jgi:hypothetical protein
MSYRLPTFNLTVNLWRNPNTVNLAPDRTFLANLSHGSRRLLVGGLVAGVAFPTHIYLMLCPKLTDVYGVDNGAALDLIECPAGSGVYYIVSSVGDTAKGFLNEHRVAVLLMATSDYLAATGNPWNAPPVPVPLP